MAGWLRITTFIVAFALAAALVGYRALAEGGMLVALGGNFFRPSFVAAAGIVEALLAVGLGSPALSNLRMLHTRRLVVLGVLRRVVRLLMAVTFAFAMLSVVGVAEPLVRVIVGILTNQIGYGTVQLSLGGVLAFVATLWVSLKLGRLVTFVFDEEVVSRVKMAPGVPYAIGTVARYLIIVFGFVIAIAIAIAMLGFQMDRLALVVSALGVGIGFGLQNPVNNFVSGVIMLFERPIRVGDRVQLDDLVGDVTSIGIRASKVHTVDGSDVIVPNSEFISTRVINWTLSDKKRRLIVPVGVRYGTGPEQVLELLLEAARENDQVLANPEPASLFLAHGESSLDFELRAFTESHLGWMVVLSDLTVSINRKLKEAGIEIPFPQRDLRLRNADVEAARTLRGDGD
jgi:potassium efflux system protein